uniref:Uncharacterized protein n=1 Tax=Heterorhabditis bacteriophora TaxID=37862 RepID=A0A1I7W9D5_HETBA
MQLIPYSVITAIDHSLWAAPVVANGT